MDTEKLVFFRSSKVRMYYATEFKRYTPNPFAEFRAFVITQRSGRWQNHLDRALDRLEWIFWSMKKAIDKDMAEYTIRGEESNILIDLGEVVESLQTTGLPMDELYFGEIYRYVAFFTHSLEIKAEYNEAEIRAIELRRGRGYRKWIREMMRSGKWKKRMRRRAMKKLKELKKVKLLEVIA